MQTNTEKFAMGNYASVRKLATVKTRLRFGDEEETASSIQYRSIDEVTPLYFAIRHGKLEDVRRCLEPGGQDVNMPIPGMLVTPMTTAAQASTPALRLLIKHHGGDVNGRDGNGSTPLIVASRAGNLDAVSLLLDASADMSVWSEVEDIPRVIKRELEAMDSMEMVGDILRCISNNQPRDAIEYRCRYLNDLLRHAAEQNILAHELLEPYLCNTALIQACREHHARVVGQLVSRGADVNARNSAGNTALHVSCGSLTADPHRLLRSSTIPSTLFIGPCVAAVQMLLHNGAKLRVKNNQGETPLQRTVRIGQLDHPLCYHEWQLHSSDVKHICENALSGVELLLKMGSDVPTDRTFIPSLWTIAENVLTPNVLCGNTQRFVNVMKMIKLCCPSLTVTDLQLDNITKYPVLCELQDFVADLTNHPVRLQDLCRVVIRSNLRDTLLKQLTELPVPQRVKDFIMFEII